MAEHKINKHKKDNPSPLQMNRNNGAVAGKKSYTIKNKGKKSG